MKKKHIIQLRDDSSFIVNADIIDAMTTNTYIYDKDFDFEYHKKHSGYLYLSLIINGLEKKFSYELTSEIVVKYYEEDVERIRYALKKIGGLL